MEIFIPVREILKCPPGAKGWTHQNIGMLLERFGVNISRPYVKTYSPERGGWVVECETLTS